MTIKILFKAKLFLLTIILCFQNRQLYSSEPAVDSTQNSSSLTLIFSPLGVGYITSSNIGGDRYVSNIFRPTDFGLYYKTKVNVVFGVEIDVVHLQLKDNKINYRDDVNTPEELIEISKAYHTSNLLSLRTAYYLKNKFAPLSIGVKTGYNFNGLEVFTDQFLNTDTSINSYYVNQTVGKSSPSNSKGFHFAPFIESELYLNNYAWFQSIFDIPPPPSPGIYFLFKIQWVNRTETFDMLLNNNYDDGSQDSSLRKETITVSSFDFNIGIAVRFD